ncbi:MAG: tetratricopeptide repeat protein [Gemmatimonadota bacterium]
MPTLSLLQRLKERKLVQWAVAYLAGAWVLYEVTATVGGPWGLTEAFFRGLFVVLVIGFLVVLVLAWYHGEKGRQRVSGPELLMVAALMVIAGGVLSVLPGRQGPDTSVAAKATDVDDYRPSIAVLPFHNRSGLEDDAYFTDGMHDQLITQLTKISDLSVRGLTSVLMYRDSPKNLRQIGQELNARYIIEGGVQRAGEVVRISVQLIGAATDEHIWASTYDRPMSVENVLSIQTEIVGAVADSVRAVVRPEEKTRIEAIPTTNLDAYELYLLGRNRWSTRSTETIREAIEYFEAAIDLDSTFAMAFTGLADAYQVLPWFDLTTEPLDVYEQAKAAATRAYQLDPRSGEARASLGLISLLFELDWVRAERHLAAAVDLAPGYPSAHHWYSNFLVSVGRFDEAVAECEKALSLDPKSNAVVWSCADRLQQAGRINESRTRYLQAIGMEPKIPWAFQTFAVNLAIEEPTDPARAGRLLAEFTTLFGYPFPDRLATVAEAIAETPEGQADAVAVLDDLVEETQLDMADLVFLYVYIAPPDIFFDVLEEAVDQRHFLVAFLPSLAHPLPGLRDDPRWEEFLTRIDYPGSVE